MEELELDERKTKILNAIIRNYLETGEPVGSRTISKYTDLNLSSATIRNEMADLEELGYILQPHTSAGRIPSDKGYRFYVDHLMEEKNREVDDMKQFVIEHTEKMEQVLQKVAKVLAANTNYATMVSAPSYHRNKVKFIQLSNVDEEQILAVIVTEGNMVKNKIIPVSEPLDNETMLKLNILLNSNLNGLALEEINLATIAKLKGQAGIHSDIVSNVLDTLGETMGQDEDIKIYTSGTTNLFKYPELSDSAEKASELISTFEEKQQLASLVTENLLDEENTGIQVYIGNESPIQTMKDCSVVTATYELGEGVRGTIGIVGPKRMDYEKVMANLNTKEAETTEDTASETEEKDTEETAEETEESSKEDSDDNKKGFFKKKKDKKDEQIEDLTDRLRRQMAEFENFRKRTEKEKSQMFDMGAKTIVEKVLPVIDNFERGLAAVPEDKKEDAFVVGMDKIYKQFLTTLEEAGVKPIEAVGQEFDPNFHNAVMHVEDEELGENIVAEELQKGYMYRDAVVRHSMVKVAN